MRAVPQVPALLAFPARRRGLYLVAGLVTLAIACGDGSVAEVAAIPETELARRQATDEAKVAGFGADMDIAARRARAAAEPPAAAPSQAPRPRPLADSAVGTMLIRTGHAFVRVDSLEPAMARLRELAASLGGVIGNVAINGGANMVRHAEIELRIPSGRFDAAMTGFAPIGKVETSSINAADVTEEFVDVRARVANARRLEARLIDLLATRTGKLEDVLAVERELARVREEIERSEGRLRWIGARVEMSTIQVVLSEREPLVGQHPGQSVLGQAFVRAWRNFIGLVAGAIASLGLLVPLGLAAFVAARWWRRRRRGSMEA